MATSPVARRLLIDDVQRALHLGRPTWNRKTGLKTSLTDTRRYQQHSSMFSARRRVRGHRRLPVVFWPIILLLAMAPALSVGLELRTTSAPTVNPGAASSIAAQLHHSPIPFLPVHVHPLGVTVPATVNPTGYYNSEPAPMGIGDFGVGLGGKPYTYNTTEFLGNFSWQHLNMNNGGVTTFTDQLNVVLYFVEGGTTYAYWIQDVAFMDSSTGELTFENNIWNFSASGCLSNSAVSGNGTVYPYSGCQGYYAVGASSQPGADEFMPSPGDFSLFVRSYLSTGGVPEVAFEYWDGVTSWEVTYDNVVWPWAKVGLSDYGFYVDGNTTAPNGIFYDAELTIGGPGGGSATVAQTVTNIGSRLFYWNGHNFEAPRSVWNFGSDTAEAVSNVQSFLTHDSDGTPHTTQLNGTARNATPARAYDQGRVGILAISAPSISSGTVAINGTTWRFLAGQAAFNLFPGVYPVWVNSTSQHNSLGTCKIQGGLTTSVSVPGNCGLSVSTPVGTPSGVDVGQSVVFSATLLGAGSGGVTFNWSSLASGLSCTSSTTSSILCRPNTPGTYPVKVTVTDSHSNSSTSGTLEFTVDSDPTVGAPHASPASVETGGSVSFSASPSGGSGNYSYTWSSLPTPCSGTGSATPSCAPGAAGTYPVSVRVADSHSYVVTSATLDYTVIPGPSVSVPVSSPAGTIDLGSWVNFSATASGGVTPYTYSWQNLPTGCSSLDVPTLECHPTAAGTSSVNVSVTDAGTGKASNGSLTFTVNAVVQIGSVTTSAPVIDLGENVTVAAHGVSGGSGVYTYSWSGFPSGCVAGNSSSVTCQPKVTGAFLANLTARDTLGSSAAAGAHFSVVADPSVASLGTSRSSVDLGQTANFDAGGIEGGVGPFQYAWSGLPDGCTSANSATLVCDPIVTGKFSVTFTVTDARNVSATRSLLFPVFARPTVNTPTLSSGSPFVAQTFILKANSTPGSGNLSYIWNGIPPGCSSANSSILSCTPTLNGTFAISVIVQDSNGVSVTSPTLSLTVEPRVVTPASAEPPYLLIAGVVVLAAAVAAVVAVVAVRRRKRAPPSGPA